MPLSYSDQFATVMNITLAVFGFVGAILMAYAHLFIDTKLSKHEKTILAAIRSDYSRKDLTDHMLADLERRIVRLEHGREEHAFR